ncbi:hypothetical protein WCQ02_42485, partial [Paraburkholderia tropica]|uniref:hypothetical protein n=1 Tax=Paraburkholderia tropica TaxID=92647 RepID=UPI0030188597
GTGRRKSATSMPRLFLAGYGCLLARGWFSWYVTDAGLQFRIGAFVGFVGSARIPIRRLFGVG